MTLLEFAELKKIIVYVANYYQRELKPEVVSMMADDLKDLDFQEVKKAYEKYRHTDKNFKFPLPGVIRGMILPEPDLESQAREISAKISTAVVKFGWANTKEAKDFLGEVAWRVVERKGGWSHICQNLGVTIDQTTFDAQNRELAKIQLQTQQNPEFGRLLNEAVMGTRMDQLEKSPEQIRDRQKLLLDQAKKMEDKS